MDHDFLNDILDEVMARDSSEQSVNQSVDKSVNQNADKPGDKSNLARNAVAITKSGAFLPFSFIENFSKSSDEEKIKKIRRITSHFTLRSVLATGHVKTSTQVKTNMEKQRFILPRFGVSEILNKKYGLQHAYCVSNLQEGVDCEMKWAATLDSNQQIIVKYLMENIYNKDRAADGSSGCILNLQAGQGKSYIAAHLIAKFGKRAVIILHSTSMIEQWRKVINTCLPGVSVGAYYTKEKTLGDIMLIIVDSACGSKNGAFNFKVKTKDKGDKGAQAKVKSDKQTKPKTEIQSVAPLDFYNQYGFIIYDECHTYCNKADSQVFQFAQARYVLGLSATPDENAFKFDRISWWQIGPVICADAIQGFEAKKTEFQACVHKICYYGDPRFTQRLVNSAGMTDTASMINMICCDEFRNEIIIDCVLACYTQGYYTYVFADRRDFLENLKRITAKRLAKKGVGESELALVSCEDEFIKLVGGASSQDMELAEVKSKIIFATYAFCGTGRSIPKMNAAILANPRKSKMKQYIGRILRLGSDIKIVRQIYDLVDMKVSFKNQWGTRKEYYDEQNFSIVEKKIKFEQAT